MALGGVLVIVGGAFVLRHRRAVAGWLRRRSAAASSRLGVAQLIQTLAAMWHVPRDRLSGWIFRCRRFRDRGRFCLYGTWNGSVAADHRRRLACPLCGQWLLDRLLPPLPTAEIESSSLRYRISLYRPTINSVLRVIVVAFAGLVLLQAWGIDALRWIEQPAAKRTLGAAISIGLVFIFAVLAWEIASHSIARSSMQDQDGKGIQRSARIRTLLPLLRKTLFIFLGLIVVLISLSEIGIDIAPLLAGAGVIGLAIGFGAQKLVQDVITGVFMLVEDALSVGDVVNVAGTGGVVEDMSIRSIRLRDLSGNVHTIPFSSVGTVTNMTKDFSYYLLDIGVDYRQDTDRVTQVCRDVVEEMRKEPAFAFDILEPLDVLGVDQFANSAIFIKARIKTEADQAMVGRSRV